MSTVAIAILSWNRASIATRALDYSLRNTGRKWDELVWVDNGSAPTQKTLIMDTLRPYNPTSMVLFSKNQGMQRGFNTLMTMPRADYVVCMPADELMPDNWLATFMEYVEKIPDTGVAVMYDFPPEKAGDRLYKKEIEVVNGLSLWRAIPMGIHIVKRSLLLHLGLFREDFGLYGWGDVEWGYRVHRILPTLGYQDYVLPMYAQHLCDDGAAEFRLGIDEDYRGWKNKEAALPANHHIIGKAQQEGWPFYWP